jgi:2TM domain
MPPRWSRKPDRKTDPDFRRLDDRMNFATHVAIFAATNSGLWFFRVLGEKTSELGIPGGLPNTPLITTIWAALVFAHGVFVFAIAKYDDPITRDS